jgi:hypothetical protein
MRSGGHLLFAPAPDWRAEPGAAVTLDIPGRVELPGIGGVLLARVIEGPAAVQRAAALLGGEVDPDPATAMLDLDRLNAPLTVRGCRPDDEFDPFGHDAQPLAEFLVRRRVPAWRRTLTPLVVAGESIAWVAGIEIAEFCRVRPESLRLLELRLRLPGEPT